MEHRSYIKSTRRIFHLSSYLFQRVSFEAFRCYIPSNRFDFKSLRTEQYPFRVTSCHLLQLTVPTGIPFMFFL